MASNDSTSRNGRQALDLVERAKLLTRNVRGQSDLIFTCDVASGSHLLRPGSLGAAAGQILRDCEELHQLLSLIDARLREAGFTR